MPTVNVSQMREHIERLVADLNRSPDDYVHVRWISRVDRAQACPTAGFIILPRVRSAISYATALHEFGHFRGKNQYSSNVLVRERWAWIWARRNALIWTPAMERNAQQSMDWYAARAAQKGPS